MILYTHAVINLDYLINGKYKCIQNNYNNFLNQFF